MMGISRIDVIGRCSFACCWSRIIGCLISISSCFLSGDITGLSIERGKTRPAGGDDCSRLVAGEGAATVELELPPPVFEEDDSRANIVKVIFCEAFSVPSLQVKLRW